MIWILGVSGYLLIVVVGSRACQWSAQHDKDMAETFRRRAAETCVCGEDIANGGGFAPNAKPVLKASSCDSKGRR